MHKFWNEEAGLELSEYFALVVFSHDLREKRNEAKEENNETEQGGG